MPSPASTIDPIFGQCIVADRNETSSRALDGDAKDCPTNDRSMLLDDPNGQDAALWPANEEESSSYQSSSDEVLRENDDHDSLCCHGSTERNFEEALEIHDFLNEYVLRSLLHAEKAEWEDVVEELFYNYSYLLDSISSFENLYRHALSWSVETLIVEDNYTTAGKTLRLALWVKFIKIPLMRGDGEEQNYASLLEFEKCMKKVFVEGYDGNMIFVLTKLSSCSCLNGLRKEYEAWTNVASCRGCLANISAANETNKCSTCNIKYCSYICHKQDSHNHELTCSEVSLELANSSYGAPSEPERKLVGHNIPGFAQTYTKAAYPFLPAPLLLYEQAMPATPPETRGLVSLQAPFSVPVDGRENQTVPTLSASAFGDDTSSSFESASSSSTEAFSLGATAKETPLTKSFESAASEGNQRQRRRIVKAKRPQA